MSTIISYLFLILAVILGTTSNTFAKSAEGFTLWLPSMITATTIVLCMYSLELDEFVQLIEMEKTQARIKHTLSTGKPLVN